MSDRAISLVSKTTWGILDGLKNYLGHSGRFRIETISLVSKTTWNILSPKNYLGHSEPSTGDVLGRNHFTGFKNYLEHSGRFRMGTISLVSKTTWDIPGPQRRNPAVRRGFTQGVETEPDQPAFLAASMSGSKALRGWAPFRNWPLTKKPGVPETPML